MGHQQVETTLRYARLYDSTIARDYDWAMAEVEDGSQQPRNRGDNSSIYLNY